MYRMFIVDDNQYERNGIRDVINWRELDIEVVGVFSNGVEVMESLDELKPHIILTDIAMPLMSGIEMAKNISENYPEIKIVFMSCYNDFDFAKSAIDLGIYGYVLKPIIPSELIKAMDKLLYEYRIEDAQDKEKEKMMKQLKDMLPIVQEQFFKELLLGNFRDLDEIINYIEFLQLDIVEGCNIHIVSIVLNTASEKMPALSVGDSYLASYTIKGIIDSFKSNDFNIFSVQISAKEYVSIILDKRCEGEIASSYCGENDAIINIAVDINLEISRKLNFTVAMGMSKCTRNLIDIPILYNQSSDAVNTKFYNGSNPIILFSEIEEAVDYSFEKKVNLEKIYQEVKELISSGTEEDIKDFITQYLSNENIKHSESYVKGFTFSVVNSTAIILMESEQSFRDIFGDDILIWGKLVRFDTIVDIKQWVFNFFKSVKDHLFDKSGTRNVKTVECIKDIIKNRYDRQLTVEDISKEIYLSSGYANAVFKRETGKTIFDYLVAYRIEVAKKMLKEMDSKVAVVAEKVGYVNNSYFCLAFKKHVGMTPAEYKNKAVL